MRGLERERIVSTLIEGIYDAALDHARWQETLEDIAAFVGGTGAILYSHDLAVNRVTWATFTGMDPDAISAYEQYYSKIDARYAPALKLPTGTVLTEGTIMEQRELKKSEIYQDFLRPYDIPHIAASVLHTDPEFVAISVQGSRRHGAFGAAELEKLQLLIPHLSRAVQIGNRLEVFQRRIGTLRQLLDTLSVGIIALDRDGCIMETNAVAAEALRRRDALICHGRRPHALSPKANVSLKQIICSALAAASVARASGPDSAPIPRIDGRRGYTLVAAPISRLSPFADDKQVAAFLILIDHDACPPSFRSSLVRRFRLSPAEANIAESLFAGLELREIASMRRTSIETTRKQVKSLLSKCGVKTQQRLMRLLAEIAFVQSTGSLT